MTSRILKLRMNVSKIDKAKLVKGLSGVYLNCTLLLYDKEDSYGNIGMIVQDIPQEERQAGLKGAILGNAKDVKPRIDNWGEDNTTEDSKDDLPF